MIQLCNNVCNNLGIYEGFAHMKEKHKYDELYEIAESQAGYFTAEQARHVGFSWERLSENAATGKFNRIQHGIYRLSHFPGTRFEDLFIAWLSAGINSVISHESALSIYELSEYLPSEIHIILPRNTSRRKKGFRIHTNALSPEEITWKEGLRVTTVERTLVDVYSSGIAQEQVELAVYQALQRGLITSESLLQQASKHSKAIVHRFQNILTREFKV
jgi:predicted transcriptional regulator of viral defense system